MLQVLAQSTGGVGRHVASIIQGLDGRQQMTVDIAAPADLRASMPKQWSAAPIPRGAVAGHAAAVARLADVIETGRYGLVHAHGLRASVDAALAGHRTGVPVIASFHNLVRREISGRAGALLYRRLEPLVVRLSARSLAVSEQIADHLLGLAPGSAAKIEVLHAGVGDAPEVSRGRAEVRAKLGLGPKARLVVTVARLVPQKALHVMLAALARLEDDVVLAVVGDGRLGSELERSALALGIAERVRWLGWRPDAADYVAAADAFCLSSIWEAVPLAAQEAVLLGVPVASTDVGGVHELIGDGRSGRLARTGDPESLAAALRDVLDEERAAVYRAQALNDYRARFSREGMLTRLDELYRTLHAPPR